MGFQFVVMFIDSFMDDVAYAEDVEVCELMLSMCLQDKRRFLLIVNTIRTDYVHLTNKP
jgi:hypothetical protein